MLCAWTLIDKEELGDIDLIIALRREFDLSSALRPVKDDIQSTRMIRLAIHGSDLYFEAIEFFCNLRAVRKSIDDYLGVTAAMPTLHEEMVRAEGVLRQIDLDERSFILRNPDTAEEVRCSISSEAGDLVELAKAGLDHRVAVAGTLRHDPMRRQVFPLLVREIAVLDTAEGYSGSGSSATQIAPETPLPLIASTL